MAGREEEDAAKALWELTNSPFGKARPPPIAAAAATAAAAAAAAAAGATGGLCLTPRQVLGDALGLGFHSPPPALHSPTVNYNKFFSPSQFSWSPLPGASPAPPHPAAHPSRGQSPAVASAAAAAGMPALSNAVQPRAAAEEAALKGSPLVEGSADGHTPGAAGLGVSGGMRKKIYSKKLDFNAPPAENGEAGRVWLALDAETQRAARARALGQQAAAPGPFSKPGGGDAQLSLSQTSAAPDFYFPSMGDPLASQDLSQQSTSSVNGSSRVGSKRTSPLKDAATGDLVMGGLLAGAGIAMPPELMDETSRPPDTSAATARAIFTPVVMNQHGGSNWGGIQVRVKKSAVKRSHDSAALAALSNALPMNEVSRSPIPAQQLKAASSSVKDAMAGMMSLAEGLFPKAGGSSNTPSRSPKVDGGANAGPAGPPTCNCKKSRCLKLYCECFRSGRTCGGSCKCKDCANSEDAAFEAERKAAMEKIIGKKKCDIFALARVQLERQEHEEKEGADAKAAETADADVEARAAPQPQEEDKAAEEGEAEEEAAAAAEPAVPTRRVTRSAAAAAEEQPSSVAAVDGAGGPPTPQVSRSNKREAERTPRQQAPGSASKRVRRTPGAAGRPDDLFLLSVFGPRSKVNKKNSLEILSYLDRDDMADACLVSSLWWKLSLETLEA